MPYPVIPDVPVGSLSSGGTTLTPVASATPTAVKVGPGRLNKVIITTLGTAVQTFYDNASAASGTILFATPASAPAGTIYTLDEPVTNGVYASGIAATPACTLITT